MKILESFISLILLGLVMSGLVLSKLFLGWDIDSDWFWFLAGIGLMVEGSMAFRRKQKASRK